MGSTKALGINNQETINGRAKEIWGWRDVVFNPTVLLTGCRKYKIHGKKNKDLMQENS